MLMHTRIKNIYFDQVWIVVAVIFLMYSKSWLELQVLWQKRDLYVLFNILTDTLQIDSS